MKKVNAQEAIRLIGNRKYKWAQVHHTWKPSHKDFNGSNHLRLQQNMKNYHVNTNGWSDIGQHLTLFPDGTFVTGRDFDRTPAGIRGYNTGSFMIEMIGNFDKGHDKLEGKQLESALMVYNHLVRNGAKILFHREKAAKSCPGTGINKSEFVRAVNNYNGKTVQPSSSSDGSVVDYMNKNNMDSSFGNRKKLADKHGIMNYKGTASQNIELLNKLKQPIKTGWKKNKVGWWYVNHDGSYPKNQWKKISGTWYHFNNRGYMQTGWLKDDGRWYWLDKSGAMVTGFVQVGGKTYFMNLSGRMTEDQDLTFTAAKSGELTLKK